MWPPYSPPLWPCRGLSSLLGVPGLPSLSGFSRECLDHPQVFYPVKVSAELWGHSFLSGSCSALHPFYSGSKSRGCLFSRSVCSLHVKVQSNADSNSVRSVVGLEMCTSNRLLEIPMLLVLGPQVE